MKIFNIKLGLAEAVFAVRLAMIGCLIISIHNVWLVTTEGVSISQMTTIGIIFSVVLTSFVSLCTDIVSDKLSPTVGAMMAHWYYGNKRGNAFRTITVLLLFIMLSAQIGNGLYCSYAADNPIRDYAKTLAKVANETEAKSKAADIAAQAEKIQAEKINEGSTAISADEAWGLRVGSQSAIQKIKARKEAIKQGLQAKANQHAHDEKMLTLQLAQDALKAETKKQNTKDKANEKMLAELDKVKDSAVSMYKWIAWGTTVISIICGLCLGLMAYLSGATKHPDFLLGGLNVFQVGKDKDEEYDEQDEPKRKNRTEIGKSSETNSGQTLSQKHDTDTSRHANTEPITTRTPQITTRETPYYDTHVQNNDTDDAESGITADYVKKARAATLSELKDMIRSAYQRTSELSKPSTIANNNRKIEFLNEVAKDRYRMEIDKSTVKITPVNGDPKRLTASFDWKDCPIPVQTAPTDVTF